MEVRPLQARSSASMVCTCAMAPFRFPPASDLMEPIWAQVPGWGFGTLGLGVLVGGRNEQ